MMEIREFHFEGHGMMPVAFPFDAICDLMKDKGLLEYARSMNNLNHQVEIMRIGLKYGHLNAKNSQFHMDAKQAKALARGNTFTMIKIYKMYEKELLKLNALGEQADKEAAEDNGLLLEEEKNV